MDTTAWTHLPTTPFYLNWETLYAAQGEYDFGIWTRIVLNQPRSVIDPNPVAAAAGSRYFGVRMMDSLTEFRCDNRASVVRASAYRDSNEGTLVTFTGSGDVSYAAPGTLGADIADLVCRRGRMAR
jgi:hypothetical protein